MLIFTVKQLTLEHKKLMNENHFKTISNGLRHFSSNCYEI